MHDELIYDWNTTQEASGGDRPSEVMLDDETLRDGLQSPSVTDPPIEAKKQILHLMNDLGIETADVGLPGAGPRAQTDVEALCREIVAAGLDIRPNCAARTLIRDIDPIIRISGDVGIPIEACVFIGSSPIRLFTEGWDEEFLLKQSAEAIAHATSGRVARHVRHRGHEPGPTGDDSPALRRGRPPGSEAGLRGGHRGSRHPRGYGRARPLRPHGARRGRRCRRRDRLARPPRPRAWGWPTVWPRIVPAPPASTVAALGIGERTGNAEIDLLLVNMKLLGWIDRDLCASGITAGRSARRSGVPIPVQLPRDGGVTPSRPRPASTRPPSSRPTDGATPGSSTTFTPGCPPASSDSASASASVP